MRKTHLILLIITLIMALFSVYSLAAINQVYTIDFEWYSQYYNKYMSIVRSTETDTWKLKDYPESLKFNVVGARDSAIGGRLSALNLTEVINGGAGKYVYLFASLEGLESPEYRVKFIDIAQRGNVVEIKLSLNSPENPKDNLLKSKNKYNPKDIIRINKNAFPIRGRLYFVFKNQYGKHLFENYYNV